MCERTRLNNRIHAITGTPLARELKKLRSHLSKPAEVDRRGCGMAVKTIQGRPFFEPADLIPRLHAFLDERGVDKHPPERNQHA